MGSQLAVVLVSTKYLHSYCKTPYFDILVVQICLQIYVFCDLVFAKEKYLLMISQTTKAKLFKTLRWDGTKMLRPRMFRRPRHLCTFLLKLFKV